MSIYTDHDLNADQRALSENIRALCAKFPETYWQEQDQSEAYPEAFVKALTDAGYLATLIPEAYGGMGLGIMDASLILEEIHRSGGNAAACHAQMYIMGTLLRHGSEEQKRRYLPQIADGSLRLQAFGVTEPDAGSDTLSLSTKAERRGDRYLVNGRKIFISRVLQSDLMTLLCRTTPIEEVRRRTDGLSVLLVDLREARQNGLEVRPIRTMLNHHTNELRFEDVEVPVENVIGEEGQGFRYILSGMNAERVLVASESIGDGRYFVQKTADYANERVVFGRPIGQNQGIQFPIARAYCAVEAARLMRNTAAQRFDAGENPGAEANMAKLLASEAAWQAANACMDTHGGYGVTAEYHIERKFREARLYQVAPVSNHMVLNFVGQNLLGMPRSY